MLVSIKGAGENRSRVSSLGGTRSLCYTTQEHWDAYGRSTGYVLQKDGMHACEVSQGYSANGRIARVSFIHEEAEHSFLYHYLPGSDLLQILSMPNGVMLTQSYEEKRNLLTGMDYVRENSLVTQRRYTYDALARPETRDTRYPNKSISHHDSFAYNRRSELTGALLDASAYTYAYDNIGNREIAQEAAEGITYAANELNQYTRISTDGENFTPEYDADGNQTLVQTSTGIWHVTYNAQNRAVKFESTDGGAIITCAYDYMGRRFEKRIEQNGQVIRHRRYLYRGYLQIAAVNLKEDASPPDLWHLIWDPTQPTATRPLALLKDGTWYTYGWDLTKNICELYGQEGYIRTIYRYSPYGTVTAEGDVTQPIQWSSEYYDNDLGLVYYNYRYYNPQDGRWTRRDPIGTLGGKNLYSTRILVADFIGLAPKGCNSVINAVNSLYKKLFSRDLPKDTRLLERWFISNILPYILEGENPWAPSFWADQYNPYDEKKTYRNYTQWLESRLTDTLNTAEQNLIDKINSQLEEKCKEENKNNTTINLTEIKFPVNNEVINKSQDANYTLSERYLDIGSFVLRVRNLNIQWNEVDRTFSWNAEVYAEDDTGANDPNGDSNDPRVILDCLALTYSDHFKPRKMEFARFPIHGSKSCDC